MVRRLVEITQETIDNSMRANSAHCMIAEAIKKAFPEVRKVGVDLQTIRFTDPIKRKRFIFLTPRAGQEALIRFDQGHEVKAFQITLTPSQIIPLRDHRKPRDPNAPRRKTRLVTPSGGAVPTRVGGKAPPEAVLSNRGQVRRFGLKALKI